MHTYRTLTCLLVHVCVCVRTPFTPPPDACVCTMHGSLRHREQSRFENLPPLIMRSLRSAHARIKYVRNENIHYIFKFFKIFFINPFLLTTGLAATCILWSTCEQQFSPNRISIFSPKDNPFADVLYYPYVITSH